MTITTLDAGLEALRAYQLLEPKQFEELASSLVPRCRDLRSLVQQMGALGWLTPYQGEQILQGRAQDLVWGPYVLLQRLGEGSMAQVFKARRPGQATPVALKILRPERAADPRVRRRFQREILAITQLAHPNIVQVYDAGNLGDTSFLVMEYVEGVDLHWLVRSLGPLPADEACDYIRQAANGLAHAHEKGLVHRDVKPGNLVLTTSGMVVKILDLGLVRLTRLASGTPATMLTADGALVGTPDFVAPEQVTDAHHVDGRADLYSLGCTFYYLLTGRPPFVGEVMEEKLFMHCTLEPEPVEKVCPAVPAKIAAIVRRLMAKRPDDRFPTAAALAIELEASTQDPLPAA